MPILISTQKGSGHLFLTAAEPLRVTRERDCGRSAGPRIELHCLLNPITKLGEVQSSALVRRNAIKEAY